MMQWLAENNFGDTRSGGLAGPPAWSSSCCWSVGTVLLIRNMNSRLRRLPDKFPTDPPPPPDPTPQDPTPPS